MNFIRSAHIAASVALATSAFFGHEAIAASLTCAEDPATNGLFCFNQKEVRLVSGIRSAPLYIGGPNGVDRSPYSVAANCDTGVLHLKDKQGVSFGGAGPGQGTTQSRQLRRLVCEAPIDTPKKK